MIRRVGPSLRAALLVWAAAAVADAEPMPPPALAGVGVEDRVGVSLPLDARFRSSTGRELSLGEVLGNGQPALLVLAYNRCEMLCSLVLRSVADVVRELPPETGDFSIVTVSIDPTDTVHEAARMQAVMLDRAGLGGQAARWEFLVGERVDIDRVAQAVGFQYAWDAATEQYAHPAVIYAVSPTGALSAYFQGLGPDPQRIADALRGEARWMDWRSVQGALLSCFRFDSAKSRYGALIDGGLAAGAGSVAFSVLGLVAWLLLRERRSRGDRAS